MTKATAVLKTIIAKSIQEDFFMIFSLWFLVMDETTDVSVTKQCAFTIIYYPDNNKVTISFFEMFEVSDAEGLYPLLKNSLIPLINQVGFSSDTTNVDW